MSLVDPRAPLNELEQQIAAEIMHWRDEPVHFCYQVFGLEMDPWQCDALDALMLEPCSNVAIQAARGVGKTLTLAGGAIWFLTTRENARIPMTAPTYNKQVRDVLFGQGIHFLWRLAMQRVPWFTQPFILQTTRLQHKTRPGEWYAVGIASSTATNVEGYRADHSMIVFDEWKGLSQSIYDAVQGMRTTAESKMLGGSTPGGLGGPFHRVMTEFRSTWKSTFVIHPRAFEREMTRVQHRADEMLNLRAQAAYLEAAAHAAPENADAQHALASFRENVQFHRSYFSDRVPRALIERLRLEWGPDSPMFVSQMKGLFPDSLGDNLIPWRLIEDAEYRMQGDAPPPGAPQRVVALDIARFGRDRTVALVGEGGTILHGESIARYPSENTNAPEIREHGVGDDPNRPEYRRTTVAAAMAYRLFIQYHADVVAIDEGGIGGGVSDSVRDLLRDQGVPVLEINFGAAPTDKPRNEDEAKLRRRRHLIESQYANLKAEMAAFLRDGFERGAIALGSLCEHEPCGDTCTPDVLLTPLKAQLWQVQMEFDSAGRYHVVDPDEQEETKGEFEGRRSPDHFHALLIYWWAANGKSRVIARAGTPKPVVGVSTIGERRGRTIGTQPGGQRLSPSGTVAGQASWVRRFYQ